MQTIDSNDDADGNEQTDARLIPARSVRSPGGLHLRRRQHLPPFGISAGAEISGQKLANDLRFVFKSSPAETVVSFATVNGG